MPPEGLPRPEEMWSGAVADASDDSHPIIGRTEEFEGRVWSVVRDRVGFGDYEATRDVIIHPGAVAVIALDDDDRILLIRHLSKLNLQRPKKSSISFALPKPGKISSPSFWWKLSPTLRFLHLSNNARTN
jgi:hypothetical protein